MAGCAIGCDASSVPVRTNAGPDAPCELSGQSRAPAMAAPCLGTCVRVKNCRRYRVRQSATPTSPLNTQCSIHSWPSGATCDEAASLRPHKLPENQQGARQACPSDRVRTFQNRGRLTHGICALNNDARNVMGESSAAWTRRKMRAITERRSILGTWFLAVVARQGVIRGRCLTEYFGWGSPAERFPGPVVEGFLSAV